MAGETSDAVSAYTQVKMIEAPRSWRLPKEECPEIWIRIPPRQRPNNWDTSYPLAGLLWERKCEEVLCEKGLEKVPTWEFSSFYVDDTHMVGNNQDMEPIWTHVVHSEIRNRPWRSNAINRSKCFWDARKEKQRLKTELFNQLTTTREVDERDQTNEKDSLEKDLCLEQWYGRSCCKVRWNMLRISKDNEFFQQVATACTDSHQILLEDYETTGEFSAACAQIVLKCL